MRRFATRKPRGVARSGVGLGEGPSLGRCGFTVVELLVTIAIIALLIGLLVPTFRAVRQTGNQTLEMSAARQLMVAYYNYANAHKGAVLPGYWPGGQAWDASGNPIDTVAARRYPWRLAPYLDYNFRSMYLNENQDLLERLENSDPVLYRRVVSLFPSLGLNATWIGGNADQGGFPEDHEDYILDYFGRFYVTRMTEARRPESLMVFASARGTDPDPALGNVFDEGEVVEGYYQISSPSFFGGYLWSEDFDPSDPPADYGYLSPRYRGSVVAVFLDSHVSLLTKKQLQDMRYWANDATSQDWTLVPPPPMP